MPQDSHFALNFAHPIADLAGFNNAVTPAAELVTVRRRVARRRRHVRTSTSHRRPVVHPAHTGAGRAVPVYDERRKRTLGARRRHAAVGRAGGAIAAPLPLVGSWVAPDPAKQTPVAGTALKLTPYTVLPGEDYTASWGGTGGTLGTSFTDQGLQFTAGPASRPAASPRPASGSAPGCGFSAPQESER